MNKLWRSMTGILMLGLVLAGLLGTVREAEATQIDDIKARGYLLVGTTGDYKSMSFLNPDTGKYEGFDIDAVKMLADDMGVEVKFVPTTYKRVVADTITGKFDIAMCGLTRTLARQQQVAQSRGYLLFGKTLVVRPGEVKKYQTLEQINRPEVRVAAPLSNTTKAFIAKNLPKATYIATGSTREIPKLLIAKKADVMICETPEARYVQNHNRGKLVAPLLDKPFTHNQFGIMLKQGDQVFLNYINLWLDVMEVNGHLDELKAKWIESETSEED